MFDTLKPGTVTISHNTQKRMKISGPSIEEVDLEEPSEMLKKMELTDTSNLLSSNKPVANSTVRRSAPSAERSPSVKRSNTKRRSSGVKQPLGLNLSFGNSPSTVRQFRRVSDKQVDSSNEPTGYPPGMDENSAPKTLFSEPSSKEAILGRRIYNKSIGLSCQEVLSTTWDQEKREAISRLAEAWSDLEMIDPEGLYQIMKSSCDKMQA